MLLSSALLMQATVVPQPAGAASEAEEPAPNSREPQYRETEHIRTFYERSRF
jgi:hypothetical protein